MSNTLDDRPATPLDNPIWSSLQTIHLDLAVVHGKVARYRSEHAPFLGVQSAAVDLAEACAALNVVDDRSTCWAWRPSRLRAGN